MQASKNFKDIKFLSKNFTVYEFQCSCCGICQVDSDFISRLQKLRDAVGHILIVTSGYRCPSHNSKINGSPTSRHMIGRAADISIAGWDASKLYTFTKAALDNGFKGVGIAKDFVHIDTRESKSKMWVY